MTNPVHWFEIATENLERAKDFYGKVFQREFQLLEMPDAKMYMFLGENEGAGTVGALIKSEQNKPSADGTIVYFECDDISNELDRIEGAGGQVIMPKTAIGEFGFISQMIDSEGNRVGLHSEK